MTDSMGIDPRMTVSSEDLAMADARTEPTVAPFRRRPNTALLIGAFVLAGVLLFALLNANRVSDKKSDLLVATSLGPQPFAAPPPPLPPSATEPGLIIPITTAPVPIPATVSYTPSTIQPYVTPSGPPAIDMGARRRAPAMIVDLGQAGMSQGGSADPARGGAGAVPGSAVVDGVAGPGPSQINTDEKFARRIGDEAPETARARPMGALDSLIPQGTVIPGVLETAINSDLPGYTRAIVSRDVVSFDGRAVLIPRGSRIIGQYKSAVAQGQSRAFIIWTRIIRPDGVSIQIGSPGTDSLGRAGLDGKVDRHFFQRFSGSILMSVLNTAVAALGQTPSTQVTIGSPGAALGAASSALQGADIPPTIKVRQGEAIQILVARDLDFSAVGPAR